MSPWYIFPFFLIPIACHSPMNHRVREEKSADLEKREVCFEKYPLCAEVQWLQGPVGNIHTDNHLLVILTDREGAPSSVPEGLTLEFYATMPSMNHAMDSAGFFTDLGEGLLTNRSIRYNMDGDWRNELWLMDEQYEIQDQVAWDEFF